MKYIEKTQSKKDPRMTTITRTSWLNIIVNALLAFVKIFIGGLTSSIAISSEGVNNATDSLSSAITIIGTKLATKHPNQKHPFGFGRFEYITSLIIAVIILITGSQFLHESIDLLIDPVPVSIDWMVLGIIAFSGVIKFILGIYTINQGKKINSNSLIAVGLDCRNDSFISAVNVISALVFLLFNITIDAYAGIFISIFILKAGLEILRDTINDILGQKGNRDLSNKIYNEIRNTKDILAAEDLVLHNYGPNNYSASVNVEFDHSKTIGDIHSVIHKLQRKIYEDYNVAITFGIYAVDYDHAGMKELMDKIESFVLQDRYAKSFHAVFLEPDTNNVFCDIVVEYDLKDWDGYQKEFSNYMKKFYPDKEFYIKIQTEFV